MHTGCGQIAFSSSPRPTFLKFHLGGAPRRLPLVLAAKRCHRRARTKLRVTAKGKIESIEGGCQKRGEKTPTEKRRVPAVATAMLLLLITCQSAKGRSIALLNKCFVRQKNMPLASRIRCWFLKPMKHRPIFMRQLNDAYFFDVQENPG